MIMIHFLMLIANSEVTGPGGLFDIDATLILVGIQFIILTIVLNIILYNPLLTIIEERNKYILTNINNASEILIKVNELTSQYNYELEKVNEETQLDIAKSQKIYKEILEIELKISQNHIDILLNTITKDLLMKKDITLNNLNDIVQILCSDIEKQLAV